MVDKTSSRRRKRKPRIDYTKPAVMRERAAAALAKRQARGEYVLGYWAEVQQMIVLTAVQSHPAGSPLVDRLTRSARMMHTWRTRQAAHQWLAGRPILAAALKVIHVPTLTEAD